ncbi:hypothetical protein T484DRAFT_2718211 [Baffinella frigidus]|nr:hypothetical protein T484DRAFT_2718211 [Cryptophyta sp. CCMP2293]
MARRILLSLVSVLILGGLGVGVDGEKGVEGQNYRPCGICGKRAMYGIPLERSLPASPSLDPWTSLQQSKGQKLLV